MTASMQSARIDAFLRPPDRASPFPNKMTSPRSKSPATAANVCVLTSAARIRASLPSASSG